MSELHELSNLLKKLEDQMTVCMKCGMCQAVCPIYSETGREMDVARGKIALLQNLAEEILKDPEAVKKRLDRCLLCGSCAANCPSGVQVLDIFIQARVILAGYLGLSPSKKAIFRLFLSHPKFFDSVLQLASRFQKVFTKTSNPDLGTSCARFKSKLIGDRHFAPLATPPWHKQAEYTDTPKEEGRFKVAFYPGCLVDKIFPQIAQSSVQVLKKHQVGLYMPLEQVCCGIPALSSGDLKAFQNLVRRNLELFADKDFDFLLTPCATCTSTIKKIWPAMADSFSGPEKNKILVLADRTLDIHEFLVNKLQIGLEEQGESDRIVTYHDPCHLRKSLGVYQEPRKILKSLPGYKFKEMPEPDRCCGMGGSFNLEHYDLSQQIGEHKLQSILETDPDLVTTGCPACMMQLMDLISHAGKKILVKHPIELYAQSLENKETSTLNTSPSEKTGASPLAI